MRSGLPRFVFWLLGVLAFGAFVLLLGEPEKNSSPTVLNRTGGGLSAFAELLRKQGYDVSHTARIESDWNSNDLVIWVRGEVQGEPTAPLLAKFRQGLDRGISLWQFSTSSQMPTLDQSVSADVELLTSDKQYTVSSNGATSAVGPVKLVDDMYGDGLASIQVQKKSTIVTWNLGDQLRNDYIVLLDQAELALDAIRLTAPSAKRVIFYEADAPGAPATNFWGQLAPWGPSFYWQVLLVVAVGVFALGRRLGPPETEGLHVSGGRNFVDAFAVLIQRSKSSRIAMTVIENVVEKRLLRAFGVPAHTPVSEVRDRLTQEERAVLQRLNAGTSGESLTDQEAFYRAKAALELVESIESRAKARR